MRPKNHDLQQRGKVWQLRIRIPKDVHTYYREKSSHFVEESLKTRDVVEARRLPVQSIIESSGTLFFAFQELDATKAAGSVEIRVETIAHYLAERSTEIIDNKQKYLPKPNWV